MLARPSIRSSTRSGYASICAQCRRSFRATTTGVEDGTSTRERVHIVEVGPRDGLQNEKTSISFDTKIELIEKLAQTGLNTIEAGSFVSPQWTPQMANSSDILKRVLQRPPPSKHPIVYQFLAPNQKGMDNLLASYTNLATPEGVNLGDTDNGPALNTSSQNPNEMPSRSDAFNPIPKPGGNLTGPEVEVSIFTAATEAFTRKNTNCSIAESLERFRSVFESAKQNNLRVRAYISVALGCPYEGPNVDPRRVAELAVNLLEMGSDQISVADTTGMGTAPKTRDLLKALAAAGVEAQDLALHFHDTYGQALVNTIVGLEAGVRTFDSAVAGLGGCPYSPGATGNVATEDMVHLLESVGFDTGVDIEYLAEVGEWIAGEIGKPNESRAGKATLARLRRIS